MLALAFIYRIFETLTFHSFGRLILIATCFNAGCDTLCICGFHNLYSLTCFVPGYIRNHSLHTSGIVKASLLSGCGQSSILKNKIREILVPQK